MKQFLHSNLDNTLQSIFWINTLHRFRTNKCTFDIPYMRNDLENFRHSKKLLNSQNMIETNRLILKPLTYEQLIKYIRLDNSLETELNLNETSRTISPELKEALELTILPNVADSNKNYLFSTIWTIISKADNKMVADLCFVGEPNAEGEIEIGYGTYEAFRKRGYMTEAVCGMIKWAKKQPNIRTILASTDKTNVDSYSILQKNNFTKSGETETLFNWRLEITKPLKDNIKE